MTDQLRRNANLVDSLGSALREGGHGLSAVPALLERVLDADSWRHFITQRGEEVHHDDFEQFVTQVPLHGLGATRSLIERIVGNNAELASRVREAFKAPGRRTDLRNNITEVKTVTGTSRTYALSRLSRSAPDLHARVLAGELSPHAAMVSAGFRPPTFTIRGDTAQDVVRTLRRRLAPDVLAEIGRLIADGNDGA